MKRKQVKILYFLCEEIMQNSYRYFQNSECEYYPCHKGEENINCLFCFCPLYYMEKCPGDYKYIEVKEKKIKECTNCTFPHKAENYDLIIKILSAKN